MNTLNFNPYKTLKSLLEITSSHIGLDFLKIICEELKILFKADLVIITEALDYNPTSCVNILYSTNKEFHSTFELEGTPCELTFQNKIVQITEDVRLNFEKEKDTDFESFYGIPIKNKNNTCIGHIAIYSNEKRIICKEIEDIALLFIRRVEAEYERIRIEKENNDLLEKLQKLTLIDQLTNIYNRRFFEQKCQEAFNQNKRLNTEISLIFIDLDNFKFINDNFSHVEGDYVLKEVSRILSSICRKDIDFVSRIGGEEFAIICFNTDIKSAKKLSKRLMEKTSEFFENKKYKVTYSIGLSTFEDNYKSWHEALGKADKNMYLSKKNGKDKITY